MNFSDFLLPQSVLAPMRVSNREEAIAALVASLGLPGSSADREDLVRAVLDREAAGSTGLGHGVAIPHARTRRLAAPRVAIGRAEPPVDFKAADHKPVSFIFLLAVPESDPQSHLKVLAALSRVAADVKLVRGLVKSKSSEQIYSLLSSLPV